MRNRKSKKGFTIVELVIVIGVIGVLTAVLVPTFVNLNNKANLANDQSMVKNMNTTLAIARAEKGDFKNAGDSIVALNENGFDGKYSPYSSSYHYGYHFESNTMYLIDGNNEVVFPSKDVSLANLWVLWNNRAVDKVSGATKYISLTNITKDSGYYNAHFGGTAEYTIDLAGHYINYETTLSNVKVTNGILINGAAPESEGSVSRLEAGAITDIVAPTQEETRTIVEKKVFNYTEVLRNKIESTKDVTYKNCYFYDWVGSGFGIMANNLSFEDCTFIDSAHYIFNVQGTTGNGYEGKLTVKGCEFINCARIFNIPLFVLGEDNPGSIEVTGNTFHPVTEQDRGTFQINKQETASGQTEKGYIDITISDNKFLGVATTQAGLFILHTYLVQCEGLSSDKITFENNQVASSIANTKYVVNDDGKPDSAWGENYKVATFKSELKSKFVKSIKQ